FASLGNPNFLAAYLAMLLPFSLYFWLRKNGPNAFPTRGPRLGTTLGLIGAGLLLLLFAGTDGQVWLHLNPLNPILTLFMGLGLFLLSLGFLGLVIGSNPWYPFVVFSILILGLLTTESRGGFLAALAAASVFFALRSRTADGANHRPALFVKIQRGPLYLFLGGTLALFGFFGFSFFERLFNSILHVGASLNTSRLHIWRPALRMIEAHPFHGVGLDTFKIAFPYYSGIGFNEIDGMFVSSRTAHNELLQIASTTGLLGLAAYLSLLVIFFLTWRKAYRGATGRLRVLLLAIFCCALAYQVQNLFSFGVCAINFLWFFCLAAVEKLSRNPLSPAEPSSTLPASRSLGRRGLCLILALGLIVFAVTRLAADIAFGRGDSVSALLKNHNPNADPDRLIYYSNYGIQEIKKASTLCPWEVKYPLYLGLAYEQRARLDGAREQKWLARAQGYYLKSLYMSPANAYYYNDLGRVEDQLALYDPKASAIALKAYEKAVFFDPASPFFRINWSQSLKRSGQKEKARLEMDKAFELDSAYAGKLLTQLALEKYQGGQAVEATAELTQAIEEDSSNAMAYFYRGLIYLDQKKWAQAQVDLNHARALDPADPRIERFLVESKLKK
ncbi:MAG: O-antigen ligase family protein, partial [bacterium]